MILLGYGVVMFLVSPRTVDARGFYWGHDARGREPGIWLLATSTLITWIFAKSVTNAANLGATFGLVGGLAYAAYYVSIPVAGYTIGSIRSRTGARSLTAYLVNTYGRGAALAFLIVVLIRLFNEIWSNTAVVASYFGQQGSGAYYAAAFVFTGFTLLYSLKGGMRSSLVTDAIQLLLAAFFLALVMGAILPRSGLGPVLGSGEFTLRGGVDLLLVALLQSLSYPFHDPVLTDRGFLAERRPMERAFLAAGIGGVGFILLSSVVGIYAFLEQIPFADDSPRAVASLLGTSTLAAMNVIMLTSAGSTLDSTLTSLSKGFGLDASIALAPRWMRTEWDTIRAGKLIMTVMAVLGNLPLFFEASILKATTISGTMVMGLAPIFLFHWVRGVPRFAFHLALWPGLVLGVLYTLGWVPLALHVGFGRYAGLLGVNLYGLILCTGLFLIPVVWTRIRAAQPRGKAGR